jgi:hypothetical protein
MPPTTRASEASPQRRRSKRKPIVRWSARHEALFRLVIEKPCLHNYQLAKLSGYSEWQVGRIKASPIWRERSAQWRAASDLALARAQARRAVGLR